MTMAVSRVLDDIAAELQAIRDQSLWKTERPLVSAQSGHIRVRSDGSARPVLNLCANNYLGLADHPELIAAAKAALDSHGLGMASVRFICGTSDLHLALEERIARYVGCEDSILYAACFDANGGLFEPLLGEGDAVVSDSLNHASIIDGIRLSKAARYRYANGDMDDLEAKLKEARAAGARRVLIVTDGVFSMDGYFAKLADIRALADRHDALVMVDDCHATGFIGPKGRGTPARAGVKVDIVTGTLGKALGGSAGGFVAAARPIVDLLRQRSRPYLFSNALPPPLVGAALKAIDLAEAGEHLRARLFDNARRFRAGDDGGGVQPLARRASDHSGHSGQRPAGAGHGGDAFRRGVYVTGFFYPVVPRDKARIRTQMSAALTDADIDEAVEAFRRVGREMGVI